MGRCRKDIKNVWILFSELNRLEFISTGNRGVRDVKEIIKEPFLSDCSGSPTPTTKDFHLVCTVTGTLFTLENMKYPLPRDLIVGRNGFKD